MSSIVQVNTNALAKFGKSLRKIAKQDAGIKFRKGLKDEAAIMAIGVKARASRFSTTIPGSIRSGATATNGYVRAGGAKARQAAAINNKGKEGEFRHPVFGRKDEPWVQQAAHPFMEPTENEKDEAAKRLVETFAKMFEES